MQTLINVFLLKNVAFNFYEMKRFWDSLSTSKLTRGFLFKKKTQKKITVFQKI